MDLDESFGFRSSFQFVPEGRYAIPDSLLREMRARGFEVNLHDLNHDGHLFDDRKEFLRRAERINAYARALGARGFRSGALYRNPDWYDALEFDFDMSIPNVGHLDAQPGGCCTVRPYFVGDIVELPLTTAQDYTVFHLLGDYSISLWQQQVGEILAHSGLVSFDVHPDYVAERQARSVYKKLLGWLREFHVRESIWMAVPSRIEHWWRARNEMHLIELAGEWVIEGPDASRGRVALVRAEGKSITCELV
jgi:hypothetical protein